MKLLTILVFASVVLTSCNKSSDSPASTVDPIYGTWTYTLQGSTNSKFKGFGGTINQDGSILFLNMYGSTDGNSATIYFRKNIGKFTRNGDEFKITYSYETCDPIKEETVYLKMNGEKLMLTNSDQSVIVAFTKSKGSDDSVQLSMIEDKDCKILAKHEAKKKVKRMIASDKAKSFADRLILE